VESVFPNGGTVRYVRGDEPGGKAATLNAGVRAASGDIIVFTDTSQRFHPGAIALWWRRCARRASAPCREVSSWRSSRAASLAALYGAWSAGSSVRKQRLAPRWE